MLSEKTVLALVRRFIQFPDAKICKHHVAATLLDQLEREGFHLSSELAAAVVSADDDRAIVLLDKEIGHGAQKLQCR